MDFSIVESPAIKALGSLFKLTEVHLWDAGSSEAHQFSYSQESLEIIEGDKDYEAQFNGAIREDLQLAKELNDLGLPLSFHTNKKTSHWVFGGKRNRTKKKNQQNHNEFADCTEDSLKTKVEEKNSFQVILNDVSKMLDESEISKKSIVEDIDVLSNLRLECGGSVSSTLNNGDDYCGEVSCLESRNLEGSGDTTTTDSSLKEIKTEGEVQANNNINEYCELGEWVAYWDDFYTRTYFYNAETGESMWDPPLGMQHLLHVAADDCCNLTNMVALDSNIPSICTTKRKKKIRKTKSVRKLSFSSQGDLVEVSPIISKYWCQRYTLFSRFDYGIMMDEEGWFSVTPEQLAKHHAVRCGDGVIVDFFTGVGGNAIQFAQRTKKVIAIDINPNKIDYARHNAAIYGVDGNIDFIKGDSFSLAPKLKASTVFMSPPWGGPNYSKVNTFDINTMLRPQDGQFLFNAGKLIAPKIVMFLPRNIDINQLAELSLSATPPWSLEVEMNYLNGRLKAVTAYFMEGTSVLSVVC